MTDVTDERESAALSAADEQVLRELTERARAGISIWLYWRAISKSPLLLTSTANELPLCRDSRLTVRHV